MRLRSLTADDCELLRRATLENINASEPRFGPDDLDQDPRLLAYTRFDPERGDFGVVADESGEPVGVSWCQFRPEDVPGYAYVDEGTPELSVWVAGPFRRQGLGRMLVAGAQQEARRRHIAVLSLSVEEGNQARMLYWSLGFQDVAGREDHGVMTWHDAI